MKPRVQVGLTYNGEIVAFIMDGGETRARMKVDRRTGNVTYTSHRYDTDEFRWMVQEARQHSSPVNPGA